MKTDNQHLDFLISQYVDGSLEGTGKKSVEQTLLTDPAARALYAEHQETQDLLDDWGSRLPMINWGEFDAKLDERLTLEAREQERVSIFRRRMKPVAAAAALFIAASLGYAWHAFSHETKLVNPIATGTVAQIPGTRTWGKIDDAISVTRPSVAGLVIDEPAARGMGTQISDLQGVVISEPENVVALRSLQDSVFRGLKNVAEVAQPQLIPAGSVMAVSPATQKDEKDAQLPR